MCDDDNRDMKVPVDLLQKLQNRRSCLGVQSAGGLVTEQNLRIRCQGSRDSYPLFLSSGKLGRIGFCLILKTYDFQKLQGSFPGLAFSFALNI